MSCIDYKYKLWHFFIIHPDILYKVCLSYDKTELFIVGFVRTLIYALMFYMTFKPVKKSKWLAPFPIVFGVGLILNILLLMFIITKQQEVPANMTQEYILKQEEVPTNKLIRNVVLKNKKTKKIPNYFFETTT